MRRKHLTLLLAVSLLLTQTRTAALAQSQPTAGQPQAPATAQAERQAAPPNQSTAPLDKRAEKVRQRVRRIGLSQTVTVIMPREADLHGTVVNIGEQSFDLAEVDQRRIITIPYAHVKKVRSGYTPPKLFTGERNSPPKGVRIAAFAGLVFAVALPLLVVASMKE
jgi:hypothetical protein